MIRTFRFWLLAILAISFIACGKEKSIDSTDGEGSGLLRMKVDGKLWTADKAASAAITEDGNLVILGQSGSKISLSMTLRSTVVGKLQLDPTSPHYAVILDESGTSPAPYATNFGADATEAGGIVELTKVDLTTKKVSGKFQFKVRSIDGKTLTITEGVFENLSFTVAGDPGTNPTPGKFTAKIDGKPWSATLATEANLTNGTLSISGFNTDQSGIILHLNSTALAEYILGPDAESDGSLVYPGLNNSFLSIVRDGANEAGGTVKLTKYDPATKKASGTFTMKLINPSNNSVRMVTEGVFEDITITTGFPNPGGNDNKLSAKIDGVDWTAESVSMVNAMGSLGVTGSNIANTKSITLSFPPGVTPGTYNLQTAPLPWGASYLVGNLEGGTGVEGEVVITEHNTTTKTLKGTFWFKAVGQTKTYQITNGSFSGKYISF